MSEPKHIAIALEIDQPYPNHQEVLDGIQQYAREHEEWRCLIDEHPGYQAKRRGASYPSYDGVIARATPEMHRRLKRQGIPLVNTHYQTARKGMAGVYADPRVGGRLLAEHLIGRGFRRLGIQFSALHKHTLEIVSSVVACAEEHEVTCEQTYMPEMSFLDATYWLDIEKLMLDWSKQLQPPVGVLIENPGTARLFLQMAQASGLRVPQDIAVLCKNNLTAALEVSPQISALDNNYQRVGYEAAQLLDRLMSGEPVADEPILVPPSGVIARESTDYFAVEDKLVAAALRFISSNLGSQIRVDDVAYELTVSPRSLQMRFSAALGRGVSEEVRRLRLEKAKRMLAEPDRQVNKIANLVGFGSSDLMNQIFRRELGITPSAYRKQVIGEQENR